MNNKKSENKINKNVSNMNTIEQVKERAREYANHNPVVPGNIIKESLKSKDVIRYDWMTKEMKAFEVHRHMLLTPEISVTNLCLFYGISEGHFRTLRLQYKDKWNAEIDDDKKMVAQNILGYAMNPLLTDEEWSEEFGNLDRYQFIPYIPSSSVNK